MARELKEDGLLLNMLSSLLKDYPDVSDSAQVYINFLMLALDTKMKNSSVPLKSFVDLIKEKRPAVFYEIERQSRYNLSLQYLIG